MKKVKFVVGTGYMGADIEEEFTLNELGIDESEYTDDELDKVIEEAYEEWVWGNVDAYWGFTD